MSPLVKIAAALVFTVVGVAALMDSDHYAKPAGLLAIVPKPVLGVLGLTLALLLLVSLAVPPADQLVTTLQHAGEKQESIDRVVGAWFCLPVLLLLAVAGLGAAPRALIEAGRTRYGLADAVIGIGLIVLVEAMFIGLVIYDAAFLHLI